VTVLDWRLQLDDKVWTAEDLTLGHLAQIEELVGEPWPVSPRQSAAHMVAFVAVLLADGDPTALDASFLAVHAMRLSEVLQLFEDAEKPEPAGA
jgi:hypothetical protein